MGGKQATSTQSVAIPPQVLAQYSAVNARASQDANTPFAQYQGQFVAPVNSEQGSGIANTNVAANEAQPYYGAATSGLGAAQAATNPVNAAAEHGTAASSSALTGSQIDSYLSPYLNDVMGSTSKLLGQQNEQAQAGQLGDAIRSGAFGGDRTGVAAANLNQQNQLASANILSGIANQGYQSALSTAQGQQQIGLAGARQLADIGSTAYGEGANTASEMGALGSGAQTAGLQGAQAQIGAGTVQQQTQQAQDTAQYQQFLQQQSYPFQVDQFLANIAEGTGALSGSTTTTTQPGGFFSDERLKQDMQVIGKTFDGQPIYRYKMKGDSRDRIGLSAQQVEKKHPQAVGLAGGFKYVDYGRATEEAANRAHFYEGGVVPFRRQRYADGGSPGGGLDAVLEAQQRMYSPQGGGAQRNIPSTGSSHQLAVAQGTPQPGPSGSDNVSKGIGYGKDAYKAYKWATKPTPSTTTPTGLSPAGAQPSGAVSYGAGTPETAVAAPQSGLGTTTYFGPAADTGTTTYFGPAAADAGTTTTFDAGLGAADTSATAASAAAPAAASGAAEGAAAEGAAGAAAGAGAGAGAAAGAAGGAAAAGAADAAATEAAALAAEYAASYAAMAAVAAKRGGRIKNRVGLAAGGSPYSYSDPNGELGIPDQEVSNEKLQSPGPLVKRPTGLQSLMKGGQPDQAMNNTGEIFSNQALATGGVAGRRGYDDGGTPDDSPDGGLSAASSTPAAVDDKASTGVAPSKHWWQKSENILPILSGLAAMGSAKTVHPGVALAAGLGAGADSYLSTRSSQAKTAEEQQRAKGLDIANQMAGLKLGVAQKAFSPKPSEVVPRQADPANPDAAQTAAGLSAQYRHQLFVNTARTPEEQAAKDEAIKKDGILGVTMFAPQADNDYESRVKRDQQNARNTAQQIADARYAQYNDPNANPTTKQVALAHYNAVRQWTGDDQEIQGGVVKNKRTGLPEIGTIAQQKLTPAEQSANLAKAQELVNVPNDNGTLTQMPSYAAPAHHAQSPQAYAQTLDPSAPALTNTGVRTGPMPVSAASPAITQGTTQSPIALEQQRMNLAAVEHVREAGDQAPNNRNINQQLLQLSAATATGPATAAVQKIAGALGLPSGSRYQEINAYLDRQAATQASAMGVPHTNAGLAASQTATGTTEYTPQALQEKVKYADALNSGTMAYREGLDKAVGTGGTPNLQKYQAFRSAWAKNFDPDIYRVEDALRRGDNAELNAIRTRLGPRGMKAFAQKSANLRALENGQIPP